MVRKFALLGAVALLLAGSGVASALDIGSDAPDFTAKGTDGKSYSLKDLSHKSEVVVVCFTCNECPVAAAYEDRFIEFTKQYQGKKVSFIALNCNNQTEGLKAMQARAEEKGFNFVYAFDETGSAARQYGARVTPELFVVKDGKIAYHGAFDDNMRKPTKAYLVSAVNSLLAGEKPEVAETRAFGCGIRVKN